MALQEVAGAISFDSLSSAMASLYDLAKYNSTTEKDVHEKCAWFVGGDPLEDDETFESFGDFDPDRNAFQQYQAQHEVAERHATLVDFYFSKISSRIKDLERVVVNDIVGVLRQAITQYLANNMTKTELASIILSFTITDALTSVLIEKRDLLASAADAMQEANLLQEQLLAPYVTLINFKIPVITPRVIKLYADHPWPFFKYLNDTVEGTEAAIMRTFEDDPINATTQLLKSFYSDVFIQEVGQVKIDLDTGVNDLAQAVEDLTQNLASYGLETQMNYKFYTENFLQVDMFYKDLSYERVEQQESFTFLSLLSEVGGFMGLLLGASVLTVCELLDYIVLIIASKCKKRRVADAEGATCATPTA